MKPLWITATLLTSTLLTLPAHASYVESCDLVATVLKPTSTIKVHLMDSQGYEFEEFRLKLFIRIVQAQPNGRADSGCHYFIGKEMKIDIAQPPAIAFKKRARIYLHYFAEDNKANPREQSFTLIPNSPAHQ